jgi:hypothetical protein
MLSVLARTHRTSAALAAAARRGAAALPAAADEPAAPGEPRWRRELGAVRNDWT